MSSLLKQAIAQEKSRRTDSALDRLKPMFKMLSEKQKQLIHEPHRFKIACAGRRSGKTMAVAAYLIYECMRAPNTPTLYIGLTRDSAREAVWGTLLALLEGCGIQHEPRPSALVIRFPNGSSITLFGGDTPNAKNRLRGRKFKLIAADETGFFTGLDPLIHALLPTLADLSGTLLMTSSPGEILAGFFYDAYEGTAKADWRQWHWDLFENPFFMGPANDPAAYKNRAEEEFDTIARLQFGGDRRHPALIREYMGVYVRDDTNLVYPYTERNVIREETPMPREEYAIGMDLGVSSECAIVIMKHSEYSREVQIVETWRQKQILIDDFAAVVSDYMDTYKPTVMIADTGGLGAAFVQELRRRYHMPIQAAEKMDKAVYQKIFANDLVSGYIKVLNNLHILREWDKIVKDETGAEAKGQSNHEADAALYVYRYLYNTYLKTFKPVESDEDKMERQAVEAALLERDQREEARDEEDLIF